MKELIIKIYNKITPGTTQQTNTRKKVQNQKKEEKIWKKFHIERGVIYGPSTGKTF